MKNLNTKIKREQTDFKSLESRYQVRTRNDNETIRI